MSTGKKEKAGRFFSRHADSVRAFITSFKVKDPSAVRKVLIQIKLFKKAYITFTEGLKQLYEADPAELSMGTVKSIEDTYSKKNELHETNDRTITRTNDAN